MIQPLQQGSQQHKTTTTITPLHPGSQQDPTENQIKKAQGPFILVIYKIQDTKFNSMLLPQILG